MVNFAMGSSAKIALFASAGRPEFCWTQGGGGVWMGTRWEEGVGGALEADLVENRSLRIRLPSPSDLRRADPTDYCLTTAAAPFLRTNFWILPVAVFGSSWTKVTLCGALKWARRSRHRSINSFSVAVAPDFRTT